MGRAKGMTKNAWAWFNSLGERIMRFGNSISLSLSLFAVAPLISVSKYLISPFSFDYEYLT